MKLIYQIILGVLLATGSLSAYAGGIMMMGGGVASEAAPSGPNITFYFNCDSATTGQTPTVGSGTVTIGASATAATGQVSNAIDTNNANDGGNIRFASSGNISSSVGTLGMYVNWNAAQDSNDMLLYSIYDPQTDFRLVAYDGDTLIWDYQGTSQNIAIPLATGTWYFLEISWDDTGNHMAYRINGGDWTESSVTGSAPTLGASIQIGGSSGYGGSPDVLIDQILVSDEYQADLYSVRAETSF